MTSTTAAAEGRLRAVTDLLVAEVRDTAGRHEYDGVVPDLSPDAVRAGLARLGGAALADADELIIAHQSATVEGRLRSVELLAQAMEPVRA